MKMISVKFLVLFLLLSFSTCFANEKESFWSRVGNEFSDIWQNGDWDLYIPVNTWHNRQMYDKVKTDTYNEKPWGIGFGKTKLDKNKNSHHLYFTVFKDSHNKWEPLIGYSFFKNWYYGKDESFKVGLGISANISARDDILSYFPFPLPLPFVRFGYKNLYVESTYIPGLYNGGNVLFTWVRFSFKI